ncbi:MAG: hypothetical protein UR27_C0002G0076 [Candidatus Peregrinibacteria bacterium GW2011_GWA2_33_10]|nr:MAG: hypothetical protein UR27_C0002G0076 [Candidatus Peregrinibacteria bacterium GW2011_GWA2_33_10]KKP41090.1 MAG: hypothetical protein UR30_C0002G0124 [Candidatus Peregrinibacteria bacterium GW2011_GWC2_33_13]
MFSFVMFITSGAAIIFIIYRRFKLTKKDIELQNKVLIEDQKIEKQKNEPLLIYKTLFNTAKEKYKFSNIQSKINNHVKIAELLKKVKYAEDRGQDEEAIQLLMQIISIDDLHLEANKKLGFLYLKKGEDSKSEFIYRKTLKSKNDPITWSNLGLCLFNQGKLEEAAEAYENSIKLDKSRAARFISLGHVYHELKKYDKALENFEYVHKLEPKNVDYMFVIADYYERKHNFAKASAMYEKILKHQPYNEEAREKIHYLSEKNNT